MSEARHWPLFRFPHPVFVDLLPPIVVLNRSPAAFSLASVSAPASTASAASFFTSAAPLAASPDQRHASHSGREPVAHSCAAFVVFTSSQVPFDTCSFSACQSASLQRSTLTAAPVAASTASSAARLARHSTKKSAAVCPFVAPSPSPTRVQSAAQSSHAAKRSWSSMFPIYLPPLPCAARRSLPAARPLLPTRASVRPRHASSLQREGPRAALIRAATTARRMSLQPWRAPLASDAPSAAVERAPLRLVACLPRGSQRRSANRRSAGRRAAARSKAEATRRPRTRSLTKNARVAGTSMHGAPETPAVGTNVASHRNPRVKNNEEATKGKHTNSSPAPELVNTSARMETRRRQETAKKADADKRG
ncbi:hypothetical protein ERJ75_000542700 [Trypanosoma vivax]|nr:hypothetical protein ERJ75_000542700 [Trypanosoma vivax]